jgi:hypothetical protein
MTGWGRSTQDFYQETVAEQSKTLSHFRIFGLRFPVKLNEVREIGFFFGLLWGRRRLNLAADLLIF